LCFESVAGRPFEGLRHPSKVRVVQPGSNSRPLPPYSPPAPVPPTEIRPEAPPAWQPSTSSPSCLRCWTPWSSRRICRGSVWAADKVGDWWFFEKSIFQTTAIWPSGVAASLFYKSLSQSSITVAISAAPELFLSPKGTPARSHGFWRKRPPHSRWWVSVAASIVFCVVVFFFDGPGHRSF